MLNTILNKCKTCKWWGSKEENPYPNYINAKLCQKIPHVVGKIIDWDACDDKYVLKEKKTQKELSIDSAGALDGSGYWGCVVTGPEFGCSLHEKEDIKNES